MTGATTGAFGATDATRGVPPGTVNVGGLGISLESPAITNVAATHAKHALKIIIRRMIILHEFPEEIRRPRWEKLVAKDTRSRWGRQWRFGRVKPLFRTPFQSGYGLQAGHDSAEDKRATDYSGSAKSAMKS